MITSHHIRHSLKQLDAYYSKASNPLTKVYISKLCILEVSGWIEESLDVMYDEMTQKLLTSAENKKDMKEKIKKLYGFSYKQHISKILRLLVGHYGVENLETKLNPKVFAPMISEIENLTISRNKLAHTYTPGATVSIDAPSITIGRFKSILIGMHDYHRTLKKCNWL
jgi:hypothetical protein